MPALRRQEGRPLEARFLRYDEPVPLTGLQALARLPLEQLRRDRAAGRRVGAYVSGYPGSPLAGFDQLLDAIAPLLAAEGVRFELGMNEELAAAAVAGSQLVDLFPHADWDGAIGLWFGKAPGVDRCLDVLRHANYAGLSRWGGALAVAGDDPGCKSSSLPSASEAAFAHAWIPLFAPARAGDVLSLGLHAYAASRYAGLWAGLKLVADVCDGGELVTVPSQPAPVVLPELALEGRPFEPRLDPRLLPPMVREIEGDLVYRRLEAVHAYAYANGIDRILGAGEGARVGVVSAGADAVAVDGAWERLGVGGAGGAAERASLGLRELRLGLVWPLEPRRLREFAAGLEHIVVVDGRRGWLETQVRDVLYELGDGAPQVLGRRDEACRPWLAREGAVDAEGLAVRLGAWLGARLAAPRLSERAAALAGAEAPGLEGAARRPHFCSGCPHLSSTRVPEGLAAAGGIGCHTMVLLQGGEMRYVGAMGSEGAAWIGLAPFVDTEHLLQNLGDGTFFHSGRQAVRACVAAGARITFKLLANGAIAMTGGQRATGEKPVAAVIEELLADGVARVVAMSDDPAVRRLAAERDAVEVVAREQLDDAQRRLAACEGVTVLVYDAACANALQRAQRRGLAPAPERRIFIQRDVCEGCGDCGRVSECLSVRPVETSLGRKTEIHQGSCSQDEVCVRGDCPAFVAIDAERVPAAPLADAPELDELEALGAGAPAPAALVRWPADDGAFSVLMVGIGSTGVVTADAILVAAAARAGLAAAHLDQTGLSQRGGRVASHLRLAPDAVCGGPVVPRAFRTGEGETGGGADLLLAFDAVGASDAEASARCAPGRTRAVLHESLAPTAEAVRRSEGPAPSLEPFRRHLAGRTRSLHGLAAEPLCEALLGSPRPANVMLLGFAFQQGLLPLAAEHLEGAIADVGVAIDTSLRAFRLGRAFALRPEAAEALRARAAAPSAGDGVSGLEPARLLGSDWTAVAALLEASEEGDALARRVGDWAADLCDWAAAPAWGRRYLATVARVARAELAARPEAPLRVTAVAARELYRLMAYKDEYEVARLQLRGPWRRWLEARTPGRVRLHFYLRPPLLRALGLGRKLRLGPWFEPVLRLLLPWRRLRGTRLDPFGLGAVRREERALPAWYEAVLAELATAFERVGAEELLRIAELPAGIRGYEGLKLERAARAREAAAHALASLRAAKPDEAAD